MDVVTVTSPTTSDTKKALVVLLHVPVEWIKVVHRKRTEGAQQSLLCVHTSNMGIHTRFGPCGGDVAITTPVFYRFLPQTDVDQFLNNNFTLHIHWLLLLDLLLNRGCWSWGGCGMCLHILKQLGQLPCTHHLTHLLELAQPSATSSWPLATVRIAANYKKYMYFNIFDMHTI